MNKIREFFWPLIEGEVETTNEIEAVSNTEIQISDENLEQAFNLKLKIFDNEEERRKSIESKAALFMSTISVATSIVVAASTLITGNQDYNLPIKVSVTISFILSVYAVRTIWFSIGALERGSYSVIDFEDINVGGTKYQYYKHLIQSIEKKIKRNRIKINDKVDRFTLAQEYYKRAIVIICIYSLLTLLFCLFSKKVIKNENKSKVEFIDSKSDNVLSTSMNGSSILIDSILYEFDTINKSEYLKNSKHTETKPAQPCQKK